MEIRVETRLHTQITMVSDEPDQAIDASFQQFLETWPTYSLLCHAYITRACDGTRDFVEVSRQDYFRRFYAEWTRLNCVMAQEQFRTNVRKGTFITIEPCLRATTRVLCDFITDPEKTPATDVLKVIGILRTSLKFLLEGTKSTRTRDAAMQLYNTETNGSFFACHNETLVHLLVLARRFQGAPKQIKFYGETVRELYDDLLVRRILHEGCHPIGYMCADCKRNYAHYSDMIAWSPLITTHDGLATTSRVFAALATLVTQQNSDIAAQYADYAEWTGEWRFQGLGGRTGAARTRRIFEASVNNRVAWLAARVMDYDVHVSPKLVERVLELLHSFELIGVFEQIACVDILDAFGDALDR